MPSASQYRCRITDSASPNSLIHRSGRPREENTKGKLGVGPGHHRGQASQFQKIADNSGDPAWQGTCAAGTEGYAESVDYVAGLLWEADYNVTLDPAHFESSFGLSSTMSSSIEGKRITPEAVPGYLRQRHGDVHECQGPDVPKQ
jgi:hypothetical protein